MLHGPKRKKGRERVEVGEHGTSLDDEKRVRRCCGQRAESGELELDNTTM